MLEVHSFQEFLNLKDKWNTLLERSENDTIFLTWEWLKLWLETFQKDSKLCILLGYIGQNELVGIAPLMVRKRIMLGLSVRSVEFIGSGDEVSPDQISFIVLEGDKRNFQHAVLEYFRKKPAEWDILHFRDIRKNEELPQDILEVFKVEQSYYEPNAVCPYVELPNTWEEYAPKLSRKFRYNIGRNEKILRNNYDIEFSTEIGPETFEQIWDKFIEIHRKRMVEKKTVGFSMEDIFWNFHKKVAKKCLEKGWLFMGILKANGNIIACQYGFIYNKKVFFYQVGMDAGFDKYSLGSIVIASMIKESIKRGCLEYDFLRGDEPYKFHWTKSIRNNFDIIVWNNTFKNTILYFGTAIKRKLKRTLRKRL